MDISEPDRSAPAAADVPVRSLRCQGGGSRKFWTGTAKRPWLALRNWSGAHSFPENLAQRRYRVLPYITRTQPKKLAGGVS
jgi:hypothetical protein